MSAVVGYLVLAAIAAVLCFTRRGRALLAAAGDALAVVAGDVVETDTPVGENTRGRQLGAWAAERDRENAAACRRYPVIVEAPPADPVLSSLAAPRWHSIRSGKDEQWLM